MNIDPNKIDFEKIKSYNSNRDREDVEQENMQNPSSDVEEKKSMQLEAEKANNTEFTENQSSLLSGWELLVRTKSLYQKRFKTLVGVSFIPFAIMFILSLVMTFGTTAVNYLFPESSSVSFLIYFIAIILMIGFVVIAITVSLWGQTAMIYAIKDSAENINIKESFKRGWQKISPFLWVSLVSGFIIIGGFFFFFIPGMIFAIWFSFAVFIVIEEDIAGMSALLKSREYVRGHWWGVFLRLVFLILTFLILIFILIIASLILTAILSIMVQDKNLVKAIVDFLGQIVTFLITPFFVIYNYLIYSNLRSIKGNFEFSPSSEAKMSYLVVSVLGLLIVPIFLYIIMSSLLGPAREMAQDSFRRIEISQIELNLELYYDENEEYPESLDSLEHRINPEVKEYLEYRQLDDGKDFELCVQLLTKEKECLNSWNSAIETLDNEETDNNITNIDSISTEFPPVLNLAQRDGIRLSDINYISIGIEKYKINNGEYPISVSPAKLNENNDVTQKIKSELGTEIPLDPKEGFYYSYASADGKSFELSTRLEDENSPNCDENIKNLCIYKVSN